MNTFAPLNTLYEGTRQFHSNWFTLGEIERYPNIRAQMAYVNEEYNELLAELHLRATASGFNNDAAILEEAVDVMVTLLMVFLHSMMIEHIVERDTPNEGKTAFPYNKSIFELLDTDAETSPYVLLISRSGAFKRFSQLELWQSFSAGMVYGFASFNNGEFDRKQLAAWALTGLVVLYTMISEGYGDERLTEGVARVVEKNLNKTPETHKFVNGMIKRKGTNNDNVSNSDVQPS